MVMSRQMKGFARDGVLMTIFSKEEVYKKEWDGVDILDGDSAKIVQSQPKLRHFGTRAAENPGTMSEEGSDGHHTGDGDRNVKALWASYNSLDVKLEALSRDMQLILTMISDRN
ncbi:hypothetical protein LWI28_003415 [Acer negundo]|uniref:Uncharacterized protein n=1 Tax=Acer negundo TaxID=4023 RepID=A0AAD5JI84_ACENE|nr:hypothetical protein LWI28_003415 [Acer negundo]